MPNHVHVGIEDVVCHFEDLEDPRSTVNRRHPLISVVVIALLAVLAGSNGPTAIAQWTLLKQDLLSTLLPLPHGIPRKDVFRRVLMALKPDAFQACFASWLRTLQQAALAAEGIEQPILAVDGKTLRRSHNRNQGLGALHSGSVWASDSGLTLAQVATDEKSNALFQLTGYGDSRGVEARRPAGCHRHHRRDGDADGHRKADCRWGRPPFQTEERACWRSKGTRAHCIRE